MIRVGVDVGGTFTDLVLEQVEAGGRRRVFTHKVSSTVADQSVGVVRGVVELCAIAGVQPGQIDALFHGTTVATNIVIERNGAEVGMITTDSATSCTWGGTSGRTTFRCSSTCPGKAPR